MPLKDYYKILELNSNASLSDIKKSFRRLALRYHPDTNQGNRYAEAWYSEVQEAYITLSDTKLREAYLQERWLLKSQGREFAKTAPLTPPFILKQMNELLEQVNNMDHFRMNHAALQQQLLTAFGDENMQVLLSYNDTPINNKAIETAIAAMFPLYFPLLKPVIKQLHQLTIHDSYSRKLVDDYYSKRKSAYIWEKYQALIILMLTVLLCAGIYFLGK